jgi:hypothetical protein
MIATGAIGLAVAVAAIVVSTTTGDPGQASADQANPADFVDITTVKPNVITPKNAGNASTGTFTVDCGENQNGHFNPDNFIVAPGVFNGAQHFHDYVGNLSTNADSNDKSLAAAGTTCKNGDQSAYFWPVLRIDDGSAEAAAAASSTTAAAAKNNGGAGKKNGGAATTTAAAAADGAAAAAAANAAQTVNCPDVASQLPAVPAQAKAEVDRNLALLDTQIAEANTRLQQIQGQGGANLAQNAVVGPLKDKRAATIARVTTAIGRNADKPAGLDKLAPCELQGGGGAGTSETATASETTTTATTTAAVDTQNNVNEGNDGTIIEPETAELTFKGSAVDAVTAMPQFLRVLEGDAKVSVNGLKNARASWTCSGFENRVIDKYPICPNGSKIKRIHTFPSCWDGKNTDSANHRDHIVYPDVKTGQCANGFKAVPQLVVTLTYNVPNANQVAKQFKVDSFPTESHNPQTDHDDFVNVMSTALMGRVVNCINTKQTCKE